MNERKKFESKGNKRNYLKKMGEQKNYSKTKEGDSSTLDN